MLLLFYFDYFPQSHQEHKVFLTALCALCVFVGNKNKGHKDVKYLQNNIVILLFY